MREQLRSWKLKFRASFQIRKGKLKVARFSKIFSCITKSLVDYGIFYVINKYFGFRVAAITKENIKIVK